MNSSTTPHESTGFKRKRTAHACEGCRQRKSRCNGARPVCDECREMGFPCLYRQPSKLSSSKLTSISERAVLYNQTSLEERLDRMEQLLQTVVANSERDRITFASRAPPNFLFASSTFGFSDPVDGMGCMTFSGEDDAGYFGHIINAIKDFGQFQVPESTSEDVTVISRAHSPPSSSESVAFSICPSYASTDPFALPPTEDVFHLLDIYFSNTGDMFPYLDKTTVLSYIIKVEQGQSDRLQPAEVCLINICLAFASVHGRPETDGDGHMENANIYFQRARLMLPEIMSKNASLESIQALLLVLQYSQGTQRSSETWRLMSSIVEGAFQIGLYRSMTTESMSPIKMEIRKRTWWMCFVMDNMTFGRPPLIANSYMRTLLPLNLSLNLDETEQISPETEQEPAASAGSSLFLHTS
ncbi:fungal-specific transcription factor domain-containing protein [Penicillium riverlandense]|uniref:fungal-specific transcription factor domain-containing protein n=1 Tax=Penicillium riverlandense TaxID=1903569 RepID=UPI002546C153|nr:fungal-specific transcription factor domain-containing protein [Penicillium riverlandense]KAJ5819743.1 fungal-specific transcription factor domain-containing protein [Penicillium riverlandense]